jgi:SAM-dependent methyltransferase
LADCGYNVVAVDKDVSRLGSLENSKIDSLRPSSIHSICADLTNRLPFNHLTFTAIVCVHYPVQTALAEFHRTLQSGGVLYIETFGGQGGNYLQLPKTGEVREFLKGYEFHVYQERSVGPTAYGAGALTLLARKAL